MKKGVSAFNCANHGSLVRGWDARLLHYSLKSPGQIDHKFHGHDKNDGFVLHEYIINKQY